MGFFDRSFIRHVILDPFTVIKRYQVISQRDSRLNEVFFQQAYHWLAMQLRPNTTVLDIGANIGDTAIYFAQFREVNKVIAYEPFPYTYKLMLRYLKQCPLSSKISPKNEAIGKQKGTINVNTNEEDSTSMTMRDMSSESGKSIKIITLSTALKGLKNVVIKCDAEGAEEYIFDNAELNQVYAMIMEWHGRNIMEHVSKRLKQCGFETKCVQSRKDEKCGMVGNLYAYKEKDL